MKRTMRKSLSLLMVMAMILTMMPMAAFAVETDATLDFTAETGTSLAGVVVTNNTAAEDGLAEGTAFPLSVTIPYAQRSTAVFVPVKTDAGATVTAYADDGTGEGTYDVIAANYDFSGANTTLWIKVVSQDLSQTRYYKLDVTVAAASDAKDITAFSFAAQTGPATINAGAGTIAIEVANGTDLTNLVATFTLSANATAAIGVTPQVSGTGLLSRKRTS